MKYFISILLQSISFQLSYSQIDDFLRARAYDIQGQSDSAFCYYSKVVDSKPNEKNLILRGNLFLKKGQLDKAIADFSRAERFRNNVASINLALSYARLHDTLNTILFIRKNLLSEYKVTAFEIKMEPAFEFLQKTDGWKNIWQQEYYSRYDQQLGELRYIFDSGDWMGVINFVSDIAVRGGEVRYEMLAMRAKAYAEMGNNDAAMEDYNNAIHTNKRSYLYFEGRADLNYKMKNFSEAETDYNQAIIIAPDIFPLYRKRGYCRIESNKCLLAIEDANLILSLFPNDKETLLLAAKANYCSGKYLKALELFNILINRQNSPIELILYRARIYVKTAMTENARKDYDQIIASYPNHIIALKERGQLRFDNNDPNGACSDWLKAEKLGDAESANLRWQNCK